MPLTAARTIRRTKMIPKSEREYDFALVLSGPAELLDLAEPVMDAFYEACHGDCTLGVSCGVPEVSFTRRAATMKDAVLSAITEVRQVGLGIDVLRIDCDYLVTAAEIARKLARAGSGSINSSTAAAAFPRRPARGTPASPCGSGPTWPLGSAGMVAPDSLLADAQSVETINCVLDYAWKSKHQAALVREVRTAVAGKRTA